MAQINAYVTEEIKQKLEDKAGKEDRSVSYVLNKLICDYLGVDKNGKRVRKTKGK